MRPPGVNHAAPPEVKMTPMIDVVFLLLIFFVWTSSFELPEFDLPSSLAESPAGTAESSSEIPPTVEVYDEVVIRLAVRNGSVVRELNGQPVAGNWQLRRRIAEILAIGVQPPVIVDPDGEVTMRDAIGAYDAARTAGADRVLFAAGETDHRPGGR